MKRDLLALVLFFSILGITANAQSSGGKVNKDEDDASCYAKWVHKFETRGADEIIDGTYSDIIITVRNIQNNTADCFVGKCDVKGGKVIAMYLKLDDGKYEKLVRKPRYEQVITINNGMSKPFMTAEEDIINVLFINKIKPKKAEFQKAPDPDAE